uniref:Uncharacterized protein n=1 Tax=Oryza brachyantha TaxID=4533 RepID=J3MHK2_ORYBR
MQLRVVVVAAAAFMAVQGAAAAEEEEDTGAAAGVPSCASKLAFGVAPEQGLLLAKRCGVTADASACAKSSSTAAAAGAGTAGSTAASSASTGNVASTVAKPTASGGSTGRLSFVSVSSLILGAEEPRVEERESASYPGLQARYVLHAVDAEVVEGVPEDGEFDTEEGGEHEDEVVVEGAAPAITVKRHYWRWMHDGAAATAEEVEEERQSANQ